MSRFIFVYVKHKKNLLQYYKNIDTFVLKHYSKNADSIWNIRQISLK